LLLAALVSLLVLSAFVAVAAAGSKSRSLSLGSTGPAVKQLQRKLHVRPVSGYFGPKTKAAVKRFQRRNGLTADGVAGPATLSRLGMRVRGSGYSTGGASPSSRGGGGGGSSVRLPAVLKRIAQCESGGNPRAISRTGRYRGKYQFDRATWEANGGRGDPAKASEARQDRIAMRLYRKRGTAPWPNCA
jgi:peptidoglycan hydrolase-like protein with peptidoglycan-binding domain